MNGEITTQVLKVDEAGRVQTPREKRGEIVAAFESSGMTGRQFATYCGVRYSTLMCWVKRYRKKKRATGAAPGLLAHIAVSRFVDHLPFYRQEQIFKTRYGVHIPRQNMVRWMEMIANRLEPVYNVIGAQVLGGDYIQMDETPIRYLDPGNGKTQTGYLWVTGKPGGDAVFRWKTSRAAQCVKDILPPEFKGISAHDILLNQMWKLLLDPNKKIILVTEFIVRACTEIDAHSGRLPDYMHQLEAKARSGRGKKIRATRDRLKKVEKALRYSGHLL